MANIFNSIPLRAPKLRSFNLTHQSKLTCEMGQLIPIMCEPVLPGERHKVSSEHLVRFAPLQAPIMSEVDCYVHYFFVPNRITWQFWEDFITGSHNGKKLPADEELSAPVLNLAKSVINLVPTIEENSESSYGTGSISNNLPWLQNGSLADYLGFQTFTKDQLDSYADSAITAYPLDPLPFLAYQRIWFDYYRDENLSTADDFSQLIGAIVSGNIITKVQNDSLQGLLSLRQRSWRKDYFTSALPWAQKGDDVLIPGSSGSFSFNNGVIPLVDRGSNYGAFSLSNPPAEGDPSVSVDSSRNPYGGYNFQTSSVLGTSSIVVNPQRLGFRSQDLNGFLNSSSATEGTIRELRRAFAAQAFLERRAVGGTRYNEQILSFFGVRTSDGRLQRAEFLGGSKQPVVVSQVLQTSQSTDSSPLGEPAGTAVSAGGKFIFDRSFEEYGFIIGIMSIMPKADYMQGIPRKYLKRDVYDYYFPQFARIGEQDIKNCELYFDFNSADAVNMGTFGYAPRYSEYRFARNTIHGDFKSTLDFWHLGRDFDSTQNLNEDFITCRPSTRIYAYENSDFNHLWVDININHKALRPMPKYAESL